MPLLASSALVREAPLPYGSHPIGNPVFEVSLKTAGSAAPLKELLNAHRLVETLLRWEIQGNYVLLDFVLWPQGIFTRVCLNKGYSLSEFLGFLREKSTPPGRTPSDYWQDELTWIRLVPAGSLEDSTNRFLQTADQVRAEMDRSQGYSPSLFFFYRNPNLRK